MERLQELPGPRVLKRKLQIPVKSEGEPVTIFTVGYADKTLSELLELMANNKITLLVDVRTRPFSRKREFNRPTLERALRTRYRWEGARLGGLSGVRCEGYIEALEWLIQKGESENICVMCMESNPDQCHRKRWIGADLLMWYGVNVEHL